MSKSKLYQIWVNMKQRCYNPNNKRYDKYKNIEVCKDWLNSFENFKVWSLSNGYREGLSIDRINNNGNYEPNNCRWANNYIQANNKSNNHYLTYQNTTLTIAQWSRLTGISEKTIRSRLRYGWDIEKTLSIKPKIGRNQYDTTI